MYTGPRLRELLIDLVSKGSYQLVVNLDKVGFLDSAGLGVLVGGLKPDHACHRRPAPGLRPLTARLGIHRRRERRVPAVPRYRPLQPLQPLGLRPQFRNRRRLLRDHHIPLRARQAPSRGSGTVVTGNRDQHVTGVIKSTR